MSLRAVLPLTSDDRLVDKCEKLESSTARAYERELKLRSGEIKKVGANCYRTDDAAQARAAADVELHPYREAEALRQVERLREVRAKRDEERVARGLEAVERAAADGENVMPAAMAAVEAYATVGEVCGALERVFGRYREVTRF